jgi:hypothetical protein
MDTLKFTHLIKDCKQAISENNILKCFSLLEESLNEDKNAYNEFILLKGNHNSILSHWMEEQISSSDYFLGLSKTRAAILKYLSSIQSDDVSMLKRIHDCILILTCKDNSLRWHSLFSEADFSNRFVINYGEKIPTEFQSPDVLILDDLGDSCAGMNFGEMVRYAKELPEANLLYVGQENPFSDSKAYKSFFDRSANANSFITVHGRLRELLEYRKYYRPEMHD